MAIAVQQQVTSTGLQNATLIIFSGGIEEAEAEQAGPSQPAATQAEEAQGSESAQEELTQPKAPLAADSNQSRVKATRGKGRGRSRGRGRGSSSRPAADSKSNAAAVHGEMHSFSVLLHCRTCHPSIRLSWTLFHKRKQAKKNDSLEAPNGLLPDGDFGKISACDTVVSLGFSLKVLPFLCQHCTPCAAIIHVVITQGF